MTTLQKMITSLIQKIEWEGVDEGYLAQAQDQYDLERRLEQLTRQA